MLRGVFCPEASLPRLIRDPSVAEKRSLRVTWRCFFAYPLLTLVYKQIVPQVLETQQSFL